MWIISILFLRTSLEFQVEFNNQMVTVKLLKKRGMRNTYLRVVAPQKIQISSNIFFTKSDALKLIENKSQWLMNGFSKLQKNLLQDNEFLFLGVKHKNLDFRDLDKFYKNEAKKLIPPLVDKYSSIMNLHPTSLKFRKNKRTWGSCNYKNELNFNFLLVKYPIEIIEYVVIHELAHIKEKNHSKNFWNLVEDYCPDYKYRMKLFKTLL